SHALYRVFIAPTQRPTLPKPTPLPLLPTTPIRPRVWNSKNTRRHAISDHYTLDAAIDHPYINLVDATGTFQPAIAITRALSSYNRTSHHLVLVSPGTPGAIGPDALPICKIVSKIEIRAQVEKKRDAERRKARGAGTGPSPKTLELNWAIGGNDLKHRLVKLQDFLREGRKVEVLMRAKRRGKVATGEECAGVLRAVREAVGECKGAGEVKEQDGVVGGVMTLVFEGRKIE
ncbi:hypothetical protein EJ04DRAFT_403580, partial [Polyplosphaeria fusca]